MSLDGDPWGPVEAEEARKRQEAHFDQRSQDDLDTALLIAYYRWRWPL